MGSQQYIWPFMILGVYLVIQGVLDFFSNSLDRRFLEINAVVFAGALIGNLLLAHYQEYVLTPGIVFVIWLVAGALLFNAVLYYLQLHYLKHADWKKKVYIFAGLAVAAVVVLFVLTSFGNTMLDVVQTQAGFSEAKSALGKTIQEEGVTSEGFFVSSYGVLNPPLMLLFAALLAAVSATLALYHKGFKRWAAALLVFSIILLFLPGSVDSLAHSFGSLVGGRIGELAVLFTTSNVFFYLLVALISTAVFYLFSEEPNRSLVLFVLIFFPIAYIGLNKLKYMIHLALALVLVAGYLLGESLGVIKSLMQTVGYSDVKIVARYALGVLFVIGLLVSWVQAFGLSTGQATYPGFQDSMNELRATRISPDWIESMQWLKDNVGSNGRVSSWWDYGHWTTFFGGTTTVLDPNNQFGDYDQQTARAFVNGNINDLYFMLDYHQATHVLIDSDLVSKWGALVFLSGSCSSEESVICPETPEIDWRNGPGASLYEAEHAFEYLTPVGECPASFAGIALPALKSSLGPVYCFGESEYFVATNQGLLPDFKRKFVLAGRDQITSMNENTAYLFPFVNNQFVNINPDLSFVGVNSSIFDSAFTRLFFFERLPGFELVYRSQQGQVKIFKYLGRGAETFSPVQPVEEPQLPAPSPEPTPEPTAELNESIEGVNATNSS
ncbi:MAG: hypothetical protein V1834_00885, partial [Candidatus Micrarchaeota archaeon]